MKLSLDRMFKRFNNLINHFANASNFGIANSKNFAVHEDMHFEFRVEAFNIFNQTQWSGVDNSACYNTPDAPDNCSTSIFLTATSAHNPRILQLAAKFVF
jgi:hypothetical protein